MARAGFAGARARKAQRAGRRWPRRAVIFALAAALGAGAALFNAAVGTLRMRAPELALRIDRDDPVALVRKAELALAAGDEAARSEAAVTGAVQRSVARLPINGPAFRLYGLSRAATGDLDTMRAQMRISDRMERRDVGAQLWLIENAVADNDIDRALRHYDRALRIEESARAILYPVLTDAMDSALIRERFAPYMAQNPPWLESFLRSAVSRTRTPSSMARLARVSGGWPEGAAFASLDTELLARLVSNGDFSAAAQHFRRIRWADGTILTSLRLTDASTDWRLAPIAWQPFRIEGIETFLLAGAQGGGAVEIEAGFESGYKGPVARKFLALAPGAYRITASMRGEGFSRRDMVSWAMTCAGDDPDRPVLREEIPFDDRMELDAQFTVPAQCPVQALMVSAQTLVTTRYVRLVLASAALDAAPPGVTPAVSIGAASAPDQSD